MQMFAALPTIQTLTIGFYQIFDNSIIIDISFVLSCFWKPILSYLRGQLMMGIKSTI